MEEQMSLVIGGVPITPDSSYELKKHSAVTQISNRISLMQRKSYNLLLYFAREQALKNPDLEMYSVNINKLRSIGGVLIKDTKHIRESLRELMTVVVDHNILGKDKQGDWGAFVLLPEVNVKNGEITFALPPSIKNALLNPRMYARINLAITRGLSSKYALALYEMARDYIAVTIPRMTLKTFRKLMGVEDSLYVNFPDLRRRVIEPAMKEINTKTDLRIEIEYIKDGRKILGIQFTATEQRDKLDDMLIDDALTQVIERICNVPELSDNDKFMLLVRGKLKDHGLDYVLSNIEYALTRAKQNKEAYTVAALEEDFAAGDRAKATYINKREVAIAAQREKESSDVETEFEIRKKKYIDYFNALDEDDQLEIISQISGHYYSGTRESRIVSYLQNKRDIVL